MLRQFSPQRIIGLFTLDWLGTLASFSIAVYLRAEIGRLPPSLTNLMHTLQIQTYNFWNDPLPGEIIPAPVALLVALIWPFFLVVYSVYDGRRNPTLASELINVFLAICTSTLALAGLLYFTYRETPRVLILIFFFIDAGLLMFARLAWGAYQTYQLRLPAAPRRAVLIIGAGPVGHNVVQQLKRYAHTAIELVGYLDDDPGKIGAQIEELKVLGDLHKASEVVAAYHVQDAVVALPLHAHERLVEICRSLQKQGVHVHVIPDLFALSFPSATLDGFGGIPVIDLGQPGKRGWRRAVKRGFDIIAVTLGLLFLSPFFALIALWIKLDSKGPVFYKQIRVGELGRPFRMYKFRSMAANASADIHKAHVTRLIQQNLRPVDQPEGAGDSLKLQDDPRITRVGKWIRKTSIDELPQMFNVLRGEMSLVGPRPPLLYEVDLYQDWHRRRFEALPGITGLWQVKGRNCVSFDEMVRMDLEYIENQSLWLDIMLLLQTPKAVAQARGAG
ncbi:MAG: sugar transferase [Chloroflexi bacterium]|nr:sugar transferase [Chloroflexota bacterium]